MDKAKDVNVTELTKAKKVSGTEEDRNREKVVRESRDQYRSFLESINRSSDRDIDRAMSRT